MNLGVKQSPTWIANRLRSTRETITRRRLLSDNDPSRLERRLLSHVAKQESGCWLWIGAKFYNGYGCFKDRRRGWARSVGAHRIAWEVWCGQIPEGILVCHSCDTPACINPTHLFLGTPSDNTVDSWKKGRSNGQHLRDEAVKARALETVRQMYRTGILTTAHDAAGRLRGRKRA